MLLARPDPLLPSSLLPSSLAAGETCRRAESPRFAPATEPRFTLAIVSGEELEGEAWHGTTRRRGAAPTGRKSVDSGRNRRRRGSALLGGGRKRAALVGRLGALLENEPFGYATLSSSVTQRNK